MSKFCASSSSSDEDSSSDSDDSVARPTAAGKFWAASSSSSSSSSDDRPTTKTGASTLSGGDDDAFSPAPHSPAASVERDPFSTPPRHTNLPANDPREAWERVRATQAFVDPPAHAGPADPSACTRIACISDTHGYHRSVPVPPCDILIHGGDFTNYGEPDMVADVSDYFSELLRTGRVRERVICIAGNHELTFEPDHYDRVWRRFPFQRSRQDGKFDARAARAALTNCTYLEDETVSVGPIKFYGSPWQPEFFDWAFNVPRADIGSRWERIPSDSDVLVTHGPPLGRGDVAHGGRVGCVSLMREVQSRIRPRLHVFGHIHEGYGVTHDGTTMYVNASSVSHNYTRIHDAIVVDLPHDRAMPARLVKPECRLGACELLAWLRKNGYKMTAKRVEEVDIGLTGSSFVEGSHTVLSCRLMIHRDDEAKAELKQAKEKLWLESFH